jgi:hypothetical protein
VRYAQNSVSKKITFEEEKNSAGVYHQCVEIYNKQNEWEFEFCVSKGKS